MTTTFNFVWLFIAMQKEEFPATLLRTILCPEFLLNILVVQIEQAVPWCVCVGVFLGLSGPLHFGVGGLLAGPREGVGLKKIYRLAIARHIYGRLINYAPDLFVGWEGCPPPNSTPLLMLLVSRVPLAPRAWSPTFQITVMPLCVSVCRDNNFWTKWPSTEIFITQFHLDTV